MSQYDCVVRNHFNYYKITIRNRIVSTAARRSVLRPMAVCTTDRYVKYYEEKSQGGWLVLCICGVPAVVSIDSPQSWWIVGKPIDGIVLFPQLFKILRRPAKNTAARSLIQITHMGRRSRVGW